MWTCVLAAEALYLFVAFHSWTNGWAQTSLFVAIFAAQFALVAWAARRGPPSTRAMLAAAILFRLTLLPAGFEDGAWQRFQLYDSDVWRYLWDGHVTASGHNPYTFAPRDRSLDPLAGDLYWMDVRDNVNYGGIPTVYPPAAQFVFLLAHPFGVLGMKLASTAFDLSALLFLMATLRILRRPMSDCLWYAWNPLAIKVFAGSGHIDSLTVASLAMLFWALAAGSRSAGFAYAIAVLSKWSPLALLPMLPWRGSILLFLPLLAIPDLFTGFSIFANFWEFNAAPHALLRTLFQSAAIAKLAAAAAVIWLACRARYQGDLEAFARQTGYTLGALILLAPAVMPWYVPWLLPAAILGGDRRWILFSGVVFLAFFVMADGRERWWIAAAEYGSLILWETRKYATYFSAWGHRATAFAGAR
jgi:hypothetical protein